MNTQCPGLSPFLVTLRHPWSEGNQSEICTACSPFTDSGDDLASHQRSTSHGVSSLDRWLEAIQKMIKAEPAPQSARGLNIQRAL